MSMSNVSIPFRVKSLFLPKVETKNFEFSLECQYPFGLNPYFYESEDEYESKISVSIPFRVKSLFLLYARRNKQWDMCQYPFGLNPYFYADKLYNIVNITDVSIPFRVKSLFLPNDKERKSNRNNVSIPFRVKSLFLQREMEQISNSLAGVNTLSG